MKQPSSAACQRPKPKGILRVPRGGCARSCRRCFSSRPISNSMNTCREVISGSGRSAQKSEKLAYFEPISEPQFEEKIGIFCRKCGIFLIRRPQFLWRRRLIPEVVVPIGELSTPDEKSATFFETNPKLSLNWTRFLGSKVALFLRKNPLKFCGLSIFLQEPANILRTFPQKKIATFDPKKRVEFDEKSGYFWENVVFSSSGDCNSPFGAATLGISQLVQKNCSPRMRQMPHFLTKIPVSRQIRLDFWGRNWKFFPISGL